MIPNIYSYSLNLVAYILSFVGCVFIIFNFFWIPLLRTSLSKIVIYPTICILLYDIVSFPVFISRTISLEVMRSTGLCYVQSSLTQYFLLANFIWMVAISINLLFLCFYPNKNLKKNEILYHVAAWGIPLIIVVLTKIPNISNDDGNQCRYRTANVIKFYVENIVIALFMIFNFIATIVTLKHIMYGSLRESETTTSSLLFNNEKKLVTKKIVWRLLLYPIILSICYILTLILDIYQFYEFNQGIRSDSELEMLLNFAKAILLFQGFFNGLVYLRSSKLRDTYKFAFQKLFCRHRYSSPDDDDSILPASEQTPYPSTFRR